MSYFAPPPPPAPVIVRRDIGGDFAAYRRQTEQYRKSGREVQLLECRSACTLALSLPNVCVYPRSTLRFNHPWRHGSGDIDRAASDELFRAYPAAVRKRLGYLTRKFVALEGHELIALGIRDCRSEAAGNSLAKPVAKAGFMTRFYRRMRVAILGTSNNSNAKQFRATKLGATELGATEPGATEPGAHEPAHAGHTLNLGQRITARAMPLGIAATRLQAQPQPDHLPTGTVPLPPPRPQYIANVPVKGQTTGTRAQRRRGTFAYSALPALIRGASPVLPTRFTAYAPLH